jgi:hypothetical protein
MNAPERDSQMPNRMSPISDINQFMPKLKYGFHLANFYETFTLTRIIVGISCT